MFKKNRLRLVLPFILLFIGAALALAQAQTGALTPTAPPSTATPAPTQPPAILVITPTPAPTPEVGLMRQVWQANSNAIKAALIGFGGLLIGILGKRMANKLADWLSRLFHFVFDPIASFPIIRWKYEKDYRKTLIEDVQYLAGGNLINKKIKLDEMYVQSVLAVDEQDGSNLADRYRTQAERRQMQREKGVKPWTAVTNHHRLLILGGPGVGKTTCLHNLAYESAKRRQADMADYFPILIHLGKVVAKLVKKKRLEAIFPEILGDNYQFPNAAKFLERMLDKGRCLILLDGLDEVPDENDYETVVTLVNQFAARRLPESPQSGNFLVVSTRRPQYESRERLRGFDIMEMQEFDFPGVDRFIHTWFKGEQKGLADKLAKNLAESPRFRELAFNPLLLLLIVDYFGRKYRLPKRRAGLYDKIVEARLSDWDYSRGIHRDKVDPETKKELLEGLAWHIMGHGKQGSIGKRELLQWLESFIQKQRGLKALAANELLTDIVETSELLKEVAIREYGFSHKTLREYFAAAAINAQFGPEAGAEQLARYLENPDWREVILFYCGLTADAELLLKIMLNRARQPGEKQRYLWLLAGECAAETRQAQGEIFQDLTKELVALLRLPEAEQPLPDAVSERVIKNLTEFAVDLLPGVARDLMASGANADLLLAGRLLPDGADDGLKAELGRRLAALTRSKDAAEQQAAVAALGRLGGAGTEGAAALLAGLADDDAAVRAEAARALARLETIDDPGAAALLQIYETDEADAARHAALEALLALGRASDVDMVAVPAGEFLMGSDKRKDKEADRDELPQHSVYLPAYFMDRTPVTNEQFGRFMAAGGYANPDYWPEAIAAKRWQAGQFIDYSDKKRQKPRFWDDKKWNDPAQPVVGVSWYESLAYARWAGKRLPTEAEWEKAARGTDGRLYPWGNEWDAAKLNSEEAKIEKTTPVGAYSPAGDSPYDAADMVGNVWEWCSTRWRNESKKEYNYPYNQDDGREDLSGGDDIWRVLRGGSWANEKKHSRCAARGGVNPRDWGDFRGFRCCCATSSLPRSGS